MIDFSYTKELGTSRFTGICINHNQSFLKQCDTLFTTFGSEKCNQPNFSQNTSLKGALSRHFCYFPAKFMNKSFFLTFTGAENIALKLGLIHQSIFCHKRKILKLLSDSILPRHAWQPCCTARLISDQVNFDICKRVKANALS